MQLENLLNSVRVQVKLIILERSFLAMKPRNYSYIHLVPAMLLLTSGCTTLLIFTIYSYQNYATLDTGSKFKTNFWVNSSLQLLKQLFLTNLVAKNTQPSTKAREFVYIKVTHVLENHVRALSHPCLNNSSDLVFFQRWENQAFYMLFFIS